MENTLIFRKQLELYIHIPFCARKCNYCDFLSFSVNAKEHEQYIDQLCREIQLTAPSVRSDYDVATIFIGGGTPSVLDPKFISRIMLYIRKNYHVLPDAEVTIEVNPASTLRYKFAAYLDAGINRLSIGLQSANNDELKALGRLHIFEDFLKCFEGARLEGFRNINVDLINDIPDQTAKSWKNSLKKVLILKPEHVSIYNLIIEDGTVFRKMNDSGQLHLPDEDTDAEIDAITKDLTARHDYHRYEVSNYAKPGFECRHNLGYWSDVPYLGFGLGAASYIDKTRHSNTRDFREYLDLPMEEEFANDCQHLYKEAEVLSRDDMMEEFMFLGLRRTAGISAIEFTERFSVDIRNVFGSQLDRFAAQGFMIRDGVHYRFTERGMDVSNVLLSEFLLH